MPFDFSILSGVASLLHIPYNWVTKLIYLAILAGIWSLFVQPHMAPVIIAANYAMNLTVYKFFPESMFLKIEQVIVFYITFKLLIWINQTQHSGLPSHSSHDHSKRR